MLDVENKIQGKTIAELKPRNPDVMPASELAPYYLKRLYEKLRINDEIDRLKGELDALSRV